MAVDRQRARISSGHDLQDVSVSGVSGPPASAVRIASDDRVFNFRAFVAHYRHLKGGIGDLKGCEFCAGGPEAVSLVVEAPVPESGVDSSAGADKEKDPSYAPGDDVPWRFGYEDPRS